MMTPQLYPNEAIHDPGTVAPNMLNDMGWGATFSPVLGIGGSNCADAIVPYEPSAPYTFPSTRLTLGQPVGTGTSGFQNMLCAGIYPRDWTIDLFASDGSTVNLLTVPNTTDPLVTQVLPSTLPSPPAGTTWMREIDGSIRAQIQAVDGDDPNPTVEVGIWAEPDPAQIAAVQDQCDNNVVVGFYASGATSYTVYYWPQDLSWTNSFAVTNGDATASVTSLSAGNTYYFQVQPANSAGGDYSCASPIANLTINKTHCGGHIIFIGEETTNNIFLQASDIVYNNAIIHAKINDIYGNSLFDDNIQLDATGRAQKSLTGLPIGPAVMQALDPVTNESLAIKQVLVTP